MPAPSPMPLEGMSIGQNRIPPYRLFRFAAFSFLLGVGFMAIAPFSFSFFSLYIAFLSSIVLVTFAWRFHRFRIALLVIVSVLFGMVRYGMAGTRDNSLLMDSIQDGRNVRGTILSEPRLYEKQQLLQVAIRGGGTARLMVYAPRLPRVLSGDEISFSCASIQLRRSNIFCSTRSLARSTEQFKTDPRRIFGSIKTYYSESVEQWIPVPHAQLLTSILIGDRSAFPRDLSMTFSHVGLSHIIAVSGYNITVLIAFLMPFVRRLRISAKYRMPLLTGSIAVFTVFSGASAATLRAALMGSSVLVASSLGRRAIGFQLLLTAASLMVLYDPIILLEDRGFQLSCMATFGLLSISPILSRACVSWPSFAGMRDILMQTIAASLGTIPLIILYFGQFSLVSFAANLFVVPLVPILMALGFLWSVLALVGAAFSGSIFSFIDPFIHLAAYPVWAILDYIMTVSSIFARVPAPILSVTSILQTIVILGSVYGALLFLHWKSQKIRAYPSPLKNIHSMV